MKFLVVKTLLRERPANEGVLGSGAWLVQEDAGHQSLQPDASNSSKEFLARKLRASRRHSRLFSSMAVVSYERKFKAKEKRKGECNVAVK